MFSISLEAHHFQSGFTACIYVGFFCLVIFAEFGIVCQYEGATEGGVPKVSLDKLVDACVICTSVAKDIDCLLFNNSSSNKMITPSLAEMKMKKSLWVAIDSKGVEGKLRALLSFTVQTTSHTQIFFNVYIFCVRLQEHRIRIKSR